MFDRILFPTDGSEGAAVAFEHVLDLAEAVGATVHVLNVPETDLYRAAGVHEQLVEERIERGERLVADAADRGATAASRPSR